VAGVNQFSIKGPHHTRRPDIVLFVNGLPLVLIELKNPADLNADIWKAFDQIQTYKAQIPDAFQYNEVLVISDGSEARWARSRPMPSASCSGAPSTASRSTRWEVQRTGDAGARRAGAGLPARLPALLRAVRGRRRAGQEDRRLSPVPRGARGHRPGGGRVAPPAVRGKGGVVWHTQGSGKSITMTCFAARVMQEPAMENPTIVVITDRNDLDGQLFGVFSLAQDLLREQPVQAEHPAGPARAARQPPVGRHRVRHHPEVHAGRGRGHVPAAVRPPQHRGDRRRGAPHAVRLRGQAQDRPGARNRPARRR
jgi:type I restriction enzyme R subunit